MVFVTWEEARQRETQDTRHGATRRQQQSHKRARVSTTAWTDSVDTLFGRRWRAPHPRDPWRADSLGGGPAAAGSDLLTAAGGARQALERDLPRVRAKLPLQAMAPLLGAWAGCAGLQGADHDPAHVGGALTGRRVGRLGLVLLGCDGGAPLRRVTRRRQRPAAPGPSLICEQACEICVSSSSAAAGVSLPSCRRRCMQRQGPDGAGEPHTAS